MSLPIYHKVLLCFIIQLSPCQASCPDPYAGKYTDQTHPDADLGKLYADDVKEIVDKVQAKGKGVAAFYAESLQSCGGQVIPPAGYLKNVYKWVLWEVCNCNPQGLHAIICYDSDSGCPDRSTKYFHWFSQIKGLKYCHFYDRVVKKVTAEI